MGQALTEPVWAGKQDHAAEGFQEETQLLMGCPSNTKDIQTTGDVCENLGRDYEGTVAMSSKMLRAVSHMSRNCYVDPVWYTVPAAGWARRDRCMSGHSICL